jgi:phage/plasmid-like protein (TIGR03299 family)
MSKETLDWLNANTLIGFTEKRGHAWHYREGSNNHYEGPVPVADVERRLFNWTAEERPLYVDSAPVGDFTDLKSPPVTVPGYKAIARSDNGEVLGIFRDGYMPHQYREWLIKALADILDDDLQIGSAVLLKGGAVACVSVETPENLTTPEGVEYRPHLLAVSSFNGTIATTYKPVVTNVVCDNTMTSALREAGPAFKVKATRNSQLRLADAREALGIVHTMADDFANEVARLTAVSFDDKSYERLVISMTQHDPDSKRGVTMAENKRDKLWELWRSDERVVEFAGTAYGAWQAVNTYQQHESPFKGGNRVERNMLRDLTGKTDAADAETLTRILELA